MLNSQSFLDIFSAIEKWLRQQAGATDRHASFYNLVETASAANPAVRRFRDELKEFADLRNAIVHERTDGRVIAEPNDRAVADFERIRLALMKPTAVIPLFQRAVRTRDISDSICAAVCDMREGAFSQLPILSNGTFVALLTSETVVRWLASEVNNDLVSLLETKIQSVLPHTEDEENVCFLPRRAALHEAVNHFENFAARGKNLDAILITEGGRGDQSILGILTVYDLPDLLESVGLRRPSSA